MQLCSTPLGSKEAALSVVRGDGGLWSGEVSQYRLIRAV